MRVAEKVFLSDVLKSERPVGVLCVFSWSYYVGPSWSDKEAQQAVQAKDTWSKYFLAPRWNGHSRMEEAVARRFVPTRPLAGGVSMPRWRVDKGRVLGALSQHSSGWRSGSTNFGRDAVLN